MDCASCASIITKKLGKVPGVSSAHVNFATETAHVTYDSAAVTPQALSATVAPLGYTLSLPDQPAHHESDLAALTAKVRFTLPLALLVFALMLWGIATRYSPVLPPFFLPMRLFDLISLVLATIVLFGFGSQFTAAIPRFIRTRTANMDTLIGIGTVAAYLYSAFVFFFPEMVSRLGLSETTYFDVVIVVIGFILLGKFLEIRSKHKTGEAVASLIKLQAKTALVRRDGKEIEIELTEVVVGDTVIVKPGQKIPVDGQILTGSTSIDESLVTGEPLPVDKAKGDSVIGGTINRQGSFEFKASKVGGNTLLSQIINLVQTAQGSKAPIERLADTVSAVFVPVVLGIAIVTLITWIGLGSFFLPLSQTVAFGLSAFVGILIIACPCALGLATPTAIITAVGKGAQSGILIKDAESLEKLHSVKTIVMDKTGTITKGKPEVVDILPLAGQSNTQILTLLSALENNSEHPLAHAILERAKAEQVQMPKVLHFKALEGKGVTGVINKTEYFAGNLALVKELHLKFDHDVIKPYTQKGYTPIVLASKKQVLGAVFVADTIKDNAREAIASLHKLGVKIVMLTGDDQDTANHIAGLVGVDNVVAEVLPDQKAAHVASFKSSGTVAMVGDGVNDAPALATADVGIAMSTGSDIALESANITLLHGDISKLVKAVKLSKSTMNTIRQNLFWAFFYNVLGIPLAAGILYPVFGIMLSPVFAGLAMAGSSVSVVTNSLRLKTLKL